MIKGKGNPVFGGIAIGKIFVYKKVNTELKKNAQDKDKELKRFHSAQDKARVQLQDLFEKTQKELGEEQAAIIDIQMMLLEDLDFIESIESMIAQGCDAAFAVNETGEAQAAMFASLEDDYMRARATDIRDISTRLVKILLDADTSFKMTEPGILIAEDLTPSETVQLEKDKILAFVTRCGSQNSHTAILARVMNIPSLVQTEIEINQALDGRTMIVDGFTGTYYIDPDQETMDLMVEKQKKAKSYKEELEKYRGMPSVTKKGQKVNLYANIGNVEDLKYVLDGDAEGIGLLRSEFLYLGRDNFPTEDELFDKYKTVVTTLKGKRVVIRTLDIGADKQVDYFGLDHEENPALGYRGIRICLKQKDIFRTQMRAILRASAFGPVSVMFPMIISVGEVEEIKRFTEEMKAELDQEGYKYGKDLELGIMIETPAAALMSDELAKHVDFFSVGTNDLTQYTLAIDRQNAKLDCFFDSHHPAVLRFLEMIAKNAHQAGIWAGICGELAADTTLTDTFLKMGYDELSVSPSRILELRKNIIESEV